MRYQVKIKDIKQAGRAQEIFHELGYYRTEEHIDLFEFEDFGNAQAFEEAIKNAGIIYDVNWQSNGAIVIQFKTEGDSTKMEKNRKAREESGKYEKFVRGTEEGIQLWGFLEFLGWTVAILSFVGGVYVLYEFGTTGDIVYGSELSVVGIAAGVAVILQGLIVGALLGAFSKLGRAVESIEERMNQDNTTQKGEDR